jgi:uncharacterized protein (DUF433 family)
VTVRYLDRPTYGYGDVDALLELTPGTARRWIDGYERAGKSYPPVVREASIGDESVTWGEYVETALLADYRDAGVPMLKLRPIVDRLRDLFGVKYPLAHVRPYVDESRQLVYDVQQEFELEESVRLVVAADRGQLLLSDTVRRFMKHADFADVPGYDEKIVAGFHPLGPERAVRIDPTHRFGQPVVRAVPTDVLAEQYRAGDSVEMIASLYELDTDQVIDALAYERGRLAG